MPEDGFFASVSGGRHAFATAKRGINRRSADVKHSCKPLRIRSNHFSPRGARNVTRNRLGPIVLQRDVSPWPKPPQNTTAGPKMRSLFHTKKSVTWSIFIISFNKPTDHVVDGYQLLHVSVAKSTWGQLGLSSLQPPVLELGHVRFDWLIFFFLKKRRPFSTFGSKLAALPFDPSVDPWTLSVSRSPFSFLRYPNGWMRAPMSPTAREQFIYIGAGLDKMLWGKKMSRPWTLPDCFILKKKAILNFMFCLFLSLGNDTAEALLLVSTSFTVMA